MRQNLLLLAACGWLLEATNARILTRNPLSNSSALSSAPLASGSSTATAKNSTLAWQTEGVAPVIPNTINLECKNWNWTSEGRDASPCVAVCAEYDEACLDAARAEAKTCSPQWDAYQKSSSAWASKYRPGSYVTTYTDYDTAVYSIFSSLSTDTDYTVTGYNGETYNPVYAFGSARLSTGTDDWVNAWTVPSAVIEQWITVTDVVTTRFSTLTAIGYQQAERTTGYPVPTPYCSITSALAQSCDQCTIAGGAVQMYYWPVPVSSNTTAPSASIPPRSNTTNAGHLVTAVVDGITMTSPSVYISVQTLFATDICGSVGSAYSGEILTMRPEDVSTVFGVEGPGYRPRNASRINFADLEGVVPASAYEMNNNCARFGCPTIYNDYYRPTLAIPSKVRSMDPAWAACGLDFEGLYDPPIALKPTTGAAGPTNPGESTSAQQTTPAVPCSTPSHSQASPTALPDSRSSQQQAQPQPTDSGSGPPQSTSSQGDTPPSPSQGEPADQSNYPAPLTSASNAAGVFSSILEPSPSNAQNPSQSQGQDSPPVVSSSQNIGGIIASIIGALPTSKTADLQPTQGSDNPAATPMSNNQYSVAPGVTLSPGAATTLSGTTYSVAQSSSFVVVNGATSALPNPVTPTAAPLLTVGSQVYTPTSSGYIVAGQTLYHGGAITVSGTTISLASSGGLVVVDGITQTLAPSATAALPVLFVGTDTITANSQGAYVINGQTLSPGSSITVSGTTISLAPSGGIAVVNGVTQTLAPSASPSPPVLTVGTDIITANALGDYMIDGQTLSPDGIITVGSGSSMTTLSMLVTNGATEVVFAGTSTEVLHASGASTTHTSTANAGATDTGTSASGGDSQTTSTGGAPSTGRKGLIWSWLLVMLSLGLIWP